MKENFCPLCGRASGRFIKGFCEECFQKKHRLVEVPEEIEFEQCKGCGKIRAAGRTLPLNNEVLASTAEKRVKVHELESPIVDVSIKEHNGRQFAEVTIKGVVDSVPLHFTKKVLLKPKTVLCDSCMRLSSQYFEATIQIRAADKQKLKEAFSLIKSFFKSQRQKESLAAIIETAEKGNSIDLKVGSKKAASHAVKLVEKELGGETKVSKKLIGVDKKGKEKFRFTFLVRV